MRRLGPHWSSGAQGPAARNLRTEMLVVRYMALRAHRLVLLLAALPAASLAAGPAHADTAVAQLDRPSPMHGAGPAAATSTATT